MFVARIAVVPALTGGTVYAAATIATGGATVEQPARRDVAFAPAETCDLETVTALAVRHPDVRQFVVMATTSFAASQGSVEVATQTRSGTWRCQRGAQPAMFGRKGTRPLAERRSGDDTTPAGVFPLGVVTAWDGDVFSMFGNRPDPGVQAPYRAVRDVDCWGATPNTSRYQHLVNRRGCAGPDEWLTSFGEAYAHAAVIGANLDPISGDQPAEIPFAAAIFLHRSSYTSTGTPKATSGCVSLGIDDLIDTIRSIDPDLDPHFAIGPIAWLRATA